jgi:hypothetical protein
MQDNLHSSAWELNKVRHARELAVIQHIALWFNSHQQFSVNILPIRLVRRDVIIPI